MAGSDEFLEALKKARLAEAAQLDALLNVHDTRVLRLQSLRAILLPALAGHEEAKALFELNVQTGERPRLWIDLISAVEMEPDPKTYRLVQDQDGVRECLFESQDADQMARFVLTYLAHRIVARQKLAVGLRPMVGSEKQPERYSFWELVYVWITGLLFGLFGLIAWEISTGRLGH